MNLRKVIFIFGGGGLIVVILAFRFGLFNKLNFVEAKSNSEISQTQSVRPLKAKKTKNTRSAAILDAPPRAPKNTPAKNIPKNRTHKNIAQNSTAAVMGKNQEDTIPSPVDPLGCGDPFRFLASDAGDFSPLSNEKSVGNITVKGMIRIKDQEPMVILQIDNTGKNYYVKTGNVIRVHEKSKTGSVVSESYIVVKSIRNDEVELIQQERPDKVIIVR
ncbi:MAG: hypothetical protein WCS73_00500 [Lentisphaeria bacterium]